MEDLYASTQIEQPGTKWIPNGNNMVESGTRWYTLVQYDESYTVWHIVMQGGTEWVICKIGNTK